MYTKPDQLEFRVTTDNNNLKKLSGWDKEYNAVVGDSGLKLFLTKEGITKKNTKAINTDLKISLRKRKPKGSELKIIINSYQDQYIFDIRIYPKEEYQQYTQEKKEYSDRNAFFMKLLKKRESESENEKFNLESVPLLMWQVIRRGWKPRQNVTYHVLAQEEISTGRLNRFPEQFLCDGSPIEVLDTCFDIKEKKVNCKKCLEIARRLSK